MNTLGRYRVLYQCRKGMCWDGFVGEYSGERYYIWTLTGSWALSRVIPFISVLKNGPVRSDYTEDFICGKKYCVAFACTEGKSLQSLLETNPPFAERALITRAIVEAAVCKSAYPALLCAALDTEGVVIAGDYSIGFAYAPPLSDTPADDFEIMRGLAVLMQAVWPEGAGEAFNGWVAALDAGDCNNLREAFVQMPEPCDIPAEDATTRLRRTAERYKPLLITAAAIAAAAAILLFGTDFTRDTPDAGQEDGKINLIGTVQLR